jgi:hypothetical protein
MQMKDFVMITKLVLVLEKRNVGGAAKGIFLWEE